MRALFAVVALGTMNACPDSPGPHQMDLCLEDAQRALVQAQAVTSTAAQCLEALEESKNALELCVMQLRTCEREQ